MSLDPSSEIQATKRDFLYIVTGEYLITGFWWAFSTIGSLVVQRSPDRDASMLFLTMAVFMLSNGIWEILTGWYADNFKRHVSMYAGFGACFVGFCLMGITLLFPESRATSGVLSLRDLVWLAGVSIWSIGPALLSGAQEAWLVDRCNFFSQSPPEDFSAVFKKSAAIGIFAKSIGTALCVSIFYFGVYTSEDSHRELVFGLSGVIGAGLSAWLFYRSYRLQEEYWSHPKYQENESLFSFLWRAVQYLRNAPSYLWFTLSYVGAMTLNYVVSSTIWPYLINYNLTPPTKPSPAGRPWDVEIGKLADNAKWYAIALILAELIGSWRSGQFSKLVDRVGQPRLRLPVVSLMYLIPIPLLFIWRTDNEAILYILILAAFSFRIVHASVFGTLNTLGQQAIETDEQRAVLVSISSAISSFLITAIFLLFFVLVPAVDAPNNVNITEEFALRMQQDFALRMQQEFAFRIWQFWQWVPLPLILLVAWGGYLAARPRTEGS